MPRIVYRNGELRGRTAKWDGVRERVISENLTKEVVPHFNNTTTCVSLWIRVFDLTGALVHEGYGGIGISWKFVTQQRDSMTSMTTNLFHMQEIERDDLFDDPSKLARAIQIAMDPDIPRK